MSIIGNVILVYFDIFGQAGTIDYLLTTILDAFLDSNDNITNEVGPIALPCSHTVPHAALWDVVATGISRYLSTGVSWV